RESAGSPDGELDEAQQPPRRAAEDDLALVSAQAVGALDSLHGVIGAHVEGHVTAEHNVARSECVDEQPRDTVVMDQAVDVDSWEVLPRCARSVDLRLGTNFVPVL